MRGRLGSLKFSALVLAILASFVMAGDAHAHRLEAEYRVLPDHRVQVESWFDLTGDSPKGARVEVCHADGQPLVEGRLDDRGLFVFSYGEAEALKVVVSAGAGHRKELVIPAAELEGATTSPNSPDGDGSSPAPLADRSSRVSVKDVLIGVGFLLALAAFVLSLRNARQLRELKS